MIDPALLTHEQRGESRYLDWALAIVFDWAEWHLRDNRKARASWSDMAARLRAQKVAYLLALHGADRLSLSADRRGILEALWEVHGEYLSTRGNLKYHNHSLPHLHGLLALARVRPEHERSARYREFVRKETPRVVASQFDQNGVHRENSPDYHFLALVTLDQYVESGWYDAETGLHRVVAKARQSARWMYLPDGRRVAVGDTGGAEDSDPVWHNRSDPTQYDQAAWETFCKSGYRVVRGPTQAPPKAASMVHFMGAFATGTHKHADDLSIVWYERGGDILVDAGKYGYQLDDARTYFTSTRAHNTVEIDETSFSTANDDAHAGAVRSVAAQEWGFELTGNLHHTRFGVTHARTILFRPGCWLVLVDRLESNEEHAYTQWLHFSPRIEMSRSDGGFRP